MKYIDPREALHDIININPELKAKLINDCSIENNEQSFYADYVLIQETTLKKIIRTLQQEYHPDKIISNPLFAKQDKTCIESIATEISQIINSSRVSIEKKSTFNYEISNQYLEFLLESNPLAFIKAITWKIERSLKIEAENWVRVYNWYDDKDSYNYYTKHINFIRDNDKDFILNREIIRKKSEIQLLSRERLENRYIALYKQNFQKLAEIRTLKEEIDKIKKEKKTLEKSLEALNKLIIELKISKENLKSEEERLRNLELSLYERLTKERTKLLEEKNILNEAKILSWTEIDEQARLLDEREYQIKNDATLIEAEKERLKQRNLELINKEIDLVKREEELKNNLGNLEEKEKSLWDLEKKLENEKEQNNKLRADAFETIEELTRYYEDKLSSKELFSVDNLSKIREWLVYIKDSYYEKLISDSKEKTLIFENIDNTDFSEMISWYEIFKNPRKSQKIFEELRLLFKSISHNFSLSIFIQESSNINKLINKLNSSEKRHAFNLFLNQVINKVTNDEKINLIKSLRNIPDNEVFEWAYRNELLKAINTYIQDIQTLEEIINYDIFEWKFTISLELEMRDIKEIISKWELDYLKQYNFFYSKLNDEKWWISLAFEIDWRNPVEDVIFDIEKKLNSF